MDEGVSRTQCSPCAGCLLACWLTVLFPSHHSPEKKRTPSPYALLLLVGAQTSKQLGEEGENKDFGSHWDKEKRAYLFLFLWNKIWLSSLLNQNTSWLFFFFFGSFSTLSLPTILLRRIVQEQCNPYVSPITISREPFYRSGRGTLFMYPYCAAEFLKFRLSSKIPGSIYNSLKWFSHVPCGD